jgi:spore germination protein GerM
MIPRYLNIAIAALLVVVLAMGIYLRHMRHQAVQLDAVATKTPPPIAPPPAGPTEPVTLYIADDNSGTLRPRSAQIPLSSGRQQRADALLSTLLRIYQQPNSSHPLAPDGEIRGIFLVDPGAAVIDLNAAFADHHRSGILTEQLTINSLIQTLASNVPGIQRVNILVEGKPRDTLAGHADLTNTFDVSAIEQAASQ